MSMNRIVWLLIVLLCGNTLAAQEVSPVTATGNPERVFSFKGYLKGLPSLDFNNLTDEVNFNNILHNRLNFRYSINQNLFFAVEVRNRLLSGALVTDYHDFMKESLGSDNGLVDASFVRSLGYNHIWHLNADRFYADWRHNNWQVRLGRQRINWGINMVSNPNDLFNTYSFFDFDYEERPGADALRIQHFTGDLARWELAINPAREAKKSVAAMMYAFNTKGIDLQFVAGYYRNRTALGAGWATHIKESGFKGEVTLFNSLSKIDSATVVAAVSLDHLFANGMYGFLEMLYNGGNRKGETNLLLMTEPMSADNIFISKYAITGSLNYPISPILSASAAAMYMPDLDGFYVMPSLSWSALTNFDLTLLAQFFQMNQGVNTLRFFRPYLQAKWSF